MKKAFLIICCTLTVGLVFSQKIDFKKDVVIVNGTPVFNLKMDVGLNAYYLYNLNGEKLAIFKIEDYYDSKKITSGNSQGRVIYYDITFLNEDIDKCEADIRGWKKSLAKYIFEYQLVDGNNLDDKAVKTFVKIHGKKFSEEKNRSTTIIIQQR